jgi:hypothetical protein
MLNVCASALLTTRDEPMIPREQPSNGRCRFGKQSNPLAGEGG